MHYVHNWRVSLISLAATYTGTMTEIYYYYGPSFVEEPISGTIMDFAYYTLLYAGVFVSILFILWASEMIKRKNFYGIRMQERETEGWKNLFNDLPEPIIFACKSEIIYYNRAVLDLFEVTEGEDAGATTSSVWTNLENLTLKTDRAVSLKSIIKTSQGGLAEETAFMYRPVDRKKQLFMIKSVNTAVITEYIFHDVTAWRTIEKTKTKTQCFDILLATASHDIKTPLNVMMGVIEVLSDLVDTASAKEQVSVALSCGQRMLYYLKGLDFLRQLNTNNLHTDLIKVNPSDLAMAIKKAMDFSAQAKGLHLALSISPTVPRHIFMDKDMYSIILQNLMENAIKYTFNGGVTVALSFDRVSDSLMTVISDTGIGMNEEQQRHVGELFKKTRNRTMMNPQGLGLGLYLAKTLTSQLNGEFTLESIPGKGTSARFTVQSTSSLQQTASTEEIWPKLDTALNSCLEIPIKPACDCTKVLVVDDEPFNLMIISAYLKSLNIKLDTAINGLLALNLVKKKADEGICCRGYSVIFMDINMPVMDGVECTKAIAKMVREDKISECKVVAVTAAAGIDKPEVYVSYLAKGFSELCNDFGLFTE